MRVDRRDDEGRQDSLINKFTNWHLLGYSVSISIGAIGLLIAFLALQEPEPGVTIEITGESNVFDIHRSLEELTIDFRGQDIQQNDLTLKFLRVKVSNAGEVDILDSHYDQEVGWGIKFDHGEVIDATLIDTNAVHLKSRANPQESTSNSVIFPRIIFDKGDFFTIEVLLLHPKGISPTISPLGKIAGIREMTVTARPVEQSESGFFAGLFPGSALTQAVRTLVYIPGSLLAITTVVLFVAGIVSLHDEWNSRNRRRRILRTRAT